MTYTLVNNVDFRNTVGPTNVTYEYLQMTRPEDGNGAVDGKCIIVHNENGQTLRKIRGFDWSKRLVEYLGVTGIHIEDIFADSRMNAETNFAVGFSIREPYSDLKIKNAICRNVRYAGGESSYQNADCFTTERNGDLIEYWLCEGIDAIDSAWDMKSPGIWIDCLGENANFGWRLRGANSEGEPDHIHYLINCTARNNARALQVHPRSDIRLFNFTFDNNGDNYDIKAGADISQVTTLTEHPFPHLRPPYPPGFTEVQKREYEERGRSRTKHKLYLAPQNVERLRTQTPKISGGLIGSIKTVTDGISSGVDGKYCETSDGMSASMQADDATAIAWFQARTGFLNARAGCDLRLGNVADGLLLRLNDDRYCLKESNAITHMARIGESDSIKGHFWRKMNATETSVPWDYLDTFIDRGRNFGANDSWTMPVSNMGTAWDEANFSLIIWWQQPDVAAADRYLFHILDTGDTEYHKIWGDSAGPFGFSTKDGVGTNDIVRSPDFSAGHRRSVYTFNAGTTTAVLHEDGAKIAEDTSARVPTGIDRINLGSKDGGGNGLTRRIAEVIILPQTLSDADALYESDANNDTFSQPGIGDLT